MTMGEPPEGGEDTRQHELVIIRRRGPDEEAPHKGGVWKIAHADFMTALMAFFLVMWLITATDDKTVTGIANYFNPMRLSDQMTRPKGVFSMEPAGDQEDGGENKKKSDKSTTNKESEASAQRSSEAAMLGKPYQELDRLAAVAGGGVPARTIGPQRGDGEHEALEGFRDPFDPEFQFSQSGDRGNGAGKKDGNGGADADVDSRLRNGPVRHSPDRPAGPVSNDPETLRQEIEQAISHSGFEALPGIDVRATKAGLMVSITDKANFEMFGIASARPKPELVVLMEKIGGIIANRPERLVIRGHTDGRPFRSDSYDNWQLSTARAHMANYMLMRSGVAEDRIDRVEGHADHDLKVPGDAYAAANRRIEILLEKPQP